MREFLEFRIVEEFADRLFGEDEGDRLGGIRRVMLPADDPRISQIGKIQSELDQQDRSFFHGWEIHRRYSKSELDVAELFHLRITAVFEPAGEQCGTAYDESVACPHCGAGRKQLSDLTLDLRKVPKAKEIARTIADEWVVSQRLAELMVDHKITGFELRPVLHVAQYQDDPFRLEEVPSGRQLIRRANAAGIPLREAGIGKERPAWEFLLWLNRPEQAPLLEAAEREAAEKVRKKSSRSLGKWYQLVVASHTVRTRPPTRFGVNPFKRNGEGACPVSHLPGMNLLSEVWIEEADWHGQDWGVTREYIGARRGVLVPRPLLVISSRLRRLFLREKIRGWKADVAHADREGAA